ncbi:MAG: helix-turn-helix transcriptional regulator [Providencia sp.]|jgi:transcriptional regulator with XRE-family HTH domain|nr:helix-turn-helix transcriptional regulator [Providencia sp.]
MKTLMLKKENNISKLIGGRIKKIRREKGISGAELGKMLQISQQQISRYERGINHISVDCLYQISVILDVNVLLLLDIEQEDVCIPIFNLKEHETYLT